MLVLFLSPCSSSTLPKILHFITDVLFSIYRPLYLREAHSVFKSRDTRSSVTVNDAIRSRASIVGRKARRLHEPRYLHAISVPPRATIEVPLHSSTLWRLRAYVSLFFSLLLSSVCSLFLSPSLSRRVYHQRSQLSFVGSPSRTRKNNKIFTTKACLSTKIYIRILKNRS